jgi:hypothetical protein
MGAQGEVGAFSHRVERYKAGRKAEQLMLSRSYLNTGYLRKYAKEYCAPPWGPTDRSISTGM